MKYKLGFVQEVKNFRHDFLYIDELKELCLKYNMDVDFANKIVPKQKNRWAIKEIFEVLENE